MAMTQSEVKSLHSLLDNEDRVTNDRIVDLEQQLQSSESYVEGANFRLAELETVLGHPTRQEDMSLHAIELMIDQVKALKIQAESAESKNSKLIAQIDSLQTEIETNSAEIDRLNEVRILVVQAIYHFIATDSWIFEGSQFRGRV